MDKHVSLEPGDFVPLKRSHAKFEGFQQKLQLSGKNLLNRGVQTKEQAGSSQHYHSTKAPV